MLAESAYRCWRCNRKLRRGTELYDVIRNDNSLVAVRTIGSAYALDRSFHVHAANPREENNRSGWKLFSQNNSWNKQAYTPSGALDDQPRVDIESKQRNTKFFSTGGMATRVDDQIARRIILVIIGMMESFHVEHPLHKSQFIDFFRNVKYNVRCSRQLITFWHSLKSSERPIFKNFQKTSLYTLQQSNIEVIFFKKM